MHMNFQIEQSLTDDISFTGGYIHSAGRHIPVYRNINRIAVIRTLADGRPVFNPAAATRLDPRFGNILMAESVGNSNYNAATFQLNKRFSQGYQFSVNYTLSKATDDAPEQNLVAAPTLSLSDPTNRRFDFGPSLADQRHTFVMSLVARPQFSFENKALRYIFSNNQLGVIATANSGERFNITSNADLNQDGITGSDRPVGVTRNAGKTPPQYNVDLRYSRFFNFTERFKMEAFAEATNIFNIRSIFQYNSSVIPVYATGVIPANQIPGTDSGGNLINGLPNFRTDFERYTARLNVNVQPKTWLRTGINMSGNYSVSTTAADGGSTNFVNPFFFSRNVGPIYPPYLHNMTTGSLVLDANGNKIWDLGNFGTSAIGIANGVPNRPSGGFAGRHALAETILNIPMFKRTVVSARNYAEISFLRNFKFTNNVSVDFQNNYSSTYENTLVGDGAPGGRSQKDAASSTGFTANQLLNYNHKFKGHSVDVLAGHETFNDYENDLNGF